MNIFRASFIGVAVLLAGCGKPDASGIYVATTGNEVAMIQLVQAQDGKVTGRIEAISLGADGSLNSKNAEVDGSISGHDLMLRPASIWFGGVQASGTFSGSKLTLTGNGDTLEAARSSLEKYQQAVAQLKEAAETKRAALASQQAQERLTSIRSQVIDIAARLRFSTKRLNEALSRSPNFAELASANTARIARMVQKAPTLADLPRNQLAVAANQVEVETNQIEVARSQYAIQLNDIVEDSTRRIASLDKLCGANPPAQLTLVCSDASTAANEFKAAVQEGQSTFTPYKQKVQRELERQHALAERIDN